MLRLRHAIPVAVGLSALFSGVMRGADAGASPFLPPSAQGNAAPVTSDSQIELRGIMAIGDGYMFSLYDTARKTSSWVKLNDRGHDFVVKNYDAQRDVVTIDYQGRSLNLTLRTAKVVSAPVVQTAPAASALTSPPSPAPQPIGGPVVLNPTPADEQRRLEAIAAEVNRRRMIRQQALQASRAAAAQGQPGGPPMPVQGPPQR
jgi:hypothetical protein